MRPAIPAGPASRSSAEVGVAIFASNLAASLRGGSSDVRRLVVRVPVGVIGSGTGTRRRLRAGLSRRGSFPSGSSGSCPYRQRHPPSRRSRPSPRAPALGVPAPPPRPSVPAAPEARAQPDRVARPSADRPRALARSRCSTVRCREPRRRQGRPLRCLFSHGDAFKSAARQRSRPTGPHRGGQGRGLIASKTSVSA